MDTMGPLGQARATMGIFALGQAKPTMDTIGPLGLARLTMDIGPLLVHWDRLGALWTGNMDRYYGQALWTG